jgi:hypothetical protein
MEAQVGQFLLGWKCPVSHFLPGQAKDLSTPLVKPWTLAHTFINANSVVNNFVIS